jgi:hypothetical protein
MGIKKEIRQSLNTYRKDSILGLKFVNALDTFNRFLRFDWRTDESKISRDYYKVFNRYPNLEEPKTLNEKIQWLKLNVHDDFHTICADKYKVREFLGKIYGEEYLVPLLYESSDYKDIKEENIPDCDCILKCNHDSGHYLIIRDKKSLNYPYIREQFRHWLRINYYKTTREWQYKNIKPHRFIIEKLLTTKDGNLPNDYKLHFFNGELQFVYVSYDRLGANDRCTYDADWKRLPFVWVPKDTYRKSMNTADVPCPPTFGKMKEIGADIAKRFRYVRVDFYDVDGKLYFGEITLHHGSGFDGFFPEEYDLIYGEKLDLTK